MAQFMTISELAKIVPLSASQLYRLAQLKQVPHLKIGARIFFEPEAIQQWIEDNTIEAVK